MTNRSRKKGIFYASNFQSSDSDIDGEEEEVEAILGHRLKKKFTTYYFFDGLDYVDRQLVNIANEQLQFLVKWKGYGPEFQTWEPGQNLQNAPKLVEQYKRNISHSMLQSNTNASSKSRKQTKPKDLAKVRQPKPGRPSRSSRSGRIQEKKSRKGGQDPDEVCIIDQAAFFRATQRIKSKNKKAPLVQTTQKRKLRLKDSSPEKQIAVKRRGRPKGAQSKKKTAAPVSFQQPWLLYHEPHPQLRPDRLQLQPALAFEPYSQPHPDEAQPQPLELQNELQPKLKNFIMSHFNAAGNQQEEKSNNLKLPFRSLGSFLNDLPQFQDNEIQKPDEGDQNHQINQNAAQLTKNQDQVNQNQHQLAHNQGQQTQNQVQLNHSQVQQAQNPPDCQQQTPIQPEQPLNAQQLKTIRQQQIIALLFDNLDSQQQQRQPSGLNRQEERLEPETCNKTQIEKRLGVQPNDERLNDNQKMLEILPIDEGLDAEHNRDGSWPKRCGNFEYAPEQTDQKLRKKTKVVTQVLTNHLNQLNPKTVTSQPPEPANDRHPTPSKSHKFDKLLGQAVSKAQIMIQIVDNDQRWKLNQRIDREIRAIFSTWPISLQNQLEEQGLPNQADAGNISNSHPVQCCRDCVKYKLSYDMLIEYLKLHLEQMNQQNCASLLQKIYEQQQTYILVNGLNPRINLETPSKLKRLMMVENQPFLENIIVRRTVRWQDLHGDDYQLGKVVWSKGEWYAVFKAERGLRDKIHYSYVRVEDLVGRNKQKLVSYLTGKE